MEITVTFEPASRGDWRAWLAEHHATAREIWVLLDRGRTSGLPYLDAVEEALCFGWIDGIAKRSGERSAQRFTPRRPRSNWTELNKERARRLIAAGLMTDAGRRVLPDLDAPYVLPPPVEAALRADPEAWANFTAFPELYQRIRAGYVAEVLRRDPAEAARRLEKLVQKSRADEMFGAWDDEVTRRRLALREAGED